MSQEEKEFAVLLANVRALANGKQGKSLIWEILSYCDLHTAGSGKFEAGKRQVGIDILTLLEEADPTIYPNLILENIDYGNRDTKQDTH